MSERFKEHDWNSCGCNSLVGSNPTLSGDGNKEQGTRSKGNKCSFVVWLAKILLFLVPCPLLPFFGRAKRGDSGAPNLQSAQQSRILWPRPTFVGSPDARNVDKWASCDDGV